MNFGLQETVSTTPAGKGEGGDRAESQAGHHPAPALPTRLCLIPASGPQPLPWQREPGLGLGTGGEPWEKQSNLSQPDNWLFLRDYGPLRFLRRAILHPAPAGQGLLNTRPSPH